MADADALYRDALAACEQGRFEDGVAILHKARAVAPDQPRIHGLLGKALIHLGRNDEALASFDRALALGSPTAGLHGSRADALVALNRREEAVESYDRALALKPDWSTTGAIAAPCCRTSAATGTPLKAFSAPLRSRPTSRRRTTISAMRWRALKRYEPALASLDRAIALEPGFADAHNNRANVLDQLGRHADALAAADRTLALAPAHRAAIVTRAIILRKLGRAEEALASCDRALPPARRHRRADGPRRCPDRSRAFRPGGRGLRPDDCARARTVFRRNGTRACSALALAASRKDGSSMTIAGRARRGCCRVPTISRAGPAAVSTVRC